MSCCPSCGAELKGPLPIDALRDLRVGGIERVVIETLIARYPRAVSGEFLIEQAYRGAREPTNARGVLDSVLRRLRNRLPPLGWAIPLERPGRASQAHYRLVRLHESPEASD